MCIYKKHWNLLFLCACLLWPSSVYSKCSPSPDSTGSTSETNSREAAQPLTNAGECYRGTCVSRECECEPGWTGEYCNQCTGRVLLDDDSGFVTDGPNNYTTGMECSWLIQPSTSSPLIRLTFLEYASECGWDYLYVYDGDSVYAPLLATFNGLVVIQGQDSSRSFFPEVVAKSGSVFINFFTDVAYQMHGFNISYEVLTCPNNCSGHGTCLVSGSTVTCDCDNEWTGDACEHPSCPFNCTENSNQGVCSKSNSTDSMMCKCEAGFQGSDCGSTVPAKKGFWTEKSVVSTGYNTARSSHSSVFTNGKMWVYGGIQFGNISHNGNLFTFDVSTGEWTIMDSGSAASPTPRYGHSLISDENKLVLFGGRDVTSNRTMDEVWEFDVVNKQWTEVSFTTDFWDPAGNSSVSPLTLWGHTGTRVDFKNGSSLMVVIFGYHPTLEYSGFVYEYNMTGKSWSLATTSGAFIEASYGHSAAWDPVSGGIYIHGGFVYLKPNSYGVTPNTYFYDPERRSFTILRPGPVPRYLHTGIVLNGLLFVYGGCTHNDSNESTGALCFSPSFMAYHTACDTWENLDSLDQTYYPNRYGHSAVVTDEMESPQMLIYGGYDSTMLKNILSYQMGSCSAFSINETYCTGQHHTSLSCSWNGTDCIPAMLPGTSSSSSCGELANSSSSYCSSITSWSCSSCVSSVANCVKCSSKCRSSNTNTLSDNCTSNTSSCGEGDITKTYCKRFRTCSQCELNPECQWDRECTFRKKSNKTAMSKCKEFSCGSVTNCSDCATVASCMWCANKGLCISTTSYVVQFPYGECMKWINNAADCPSLGCINHSTCGTCHADPFCGWCDDGSMTGLGKCQSGAASGPLLDGASSNVISPTVHSNTTCPANSWFFTDCPLCQCNGHSKCEDKTSRCESCQDKTTGDQCQDCVDGYFGDATNGGSCSPCECFDRAEYCNNTSGDCFCFTKGEIGAKCEKCNSNGKYYGDPSNNGTCFYRLLINYSFTFTLTEDHDKYVTNINFENTPPLENNAELSLESQKPCNVRLTVYYRERVYSSLSDTMDVNGTSTEEEQYAEHEVEVGEHFGVEKLSFDFSGSKYGFGDSKTNATIRIYVSNMTVPIRLQISLVQTSNRLLILLLILFSCFLVLLLLTALVWKLKMLYDACQHRRQQAEQLEQMAARPFSTVQLCFDDVYGSKQTLKTLLSAEHPQGIDGVSEESTADGFVSAVSVIMWMPSGNLDMGSLMSIDEDKSMNSFLEERPENSALAIGTTLLTRSKRRESGETGVNTEQPSGSLSRAEKFKVVFKRRRPTHENPPAPRQSGHCTTQHNASNNRMFSMDEEQATQTTIATRDEPVRHRPSKRGRSSFTSIRSGSVSPTGRVDSYSIASSSSPPPPATQTNRQPRPHPIVLAYEVPSREKEGVSV